MSHNKRIEMAMAVPSIQAAITRHQAGQLIEAEEICCQILRSESNNADALDLLGVIAQQTKRYGAAAKLIEWAVLAQPSNARFMNHLGDAYCALGRIDEAEARYREAVALCGGYAEAHNNLGKLLLKAGRLNDAVDAFRQVLALQPDCADAYYNLGIALQDLGCPGRAEDAYRRALSLNPHHANACNNLGNVLLKLGRRKEAEESYRRAIALKHDFAAAHNNLGTVLSAERLKEAEESYRRALAANPQYVEALSNLGSVLRAIGRLKEGETLFREALALNHDYPEAHNNLGNLFRDSGRLKDAEECYRRAIALKPYYAEAYNNLGNALLDLGRTSEAQRCYERALAINPRYMEARGLRAYVSQQLCDWTHIVEEARTLRNLVTTSKWGTVQPFGFLALPDVTAGEQLACARQFAERMLGPFLADTSAQPKYLRSSGKLRLGYLSADYCEHATSYLLAEIIELHDRGRFDVSGYSYGPDDNGPMRKRMQAAFDKFIDIRDLSYAAAARQLVDDDIDILIDLKGYTKNNRIQIAALRPGRVQVSWLGYPGTVGHPRLADYIIGDSITTPLQHGEYYSEALAIMPNCYQPNDRQRAVGERPSRTEAGLPEKGFIFCSFSQTYKITPPAFGLWCRLLQMVPDSILWLLESNPAAQESLRKGALARGVAASRLYFAPKAKLEEHLGRLQLADLALDTYPYTSHTTASDALWAGVPLITRIGPTFVSRVAASVLHAARIPELITEDWDSYYRLALDLATNGGRLRALKAKLTLNRSTCPLFDSERFTFDLESLYEAMWSNYLSGKKTHIDLSRAC